MIIAGKTIPVTGVSQFVAEDWRDSAAKGLERQLAALAQGMSSGRD